MIRFLPLPAETVAPWRAGGRDAYGQLPERGISDGRGTPCRHCLRQVPRGAPFLLLAHRPFAGLNPSAETGPIFVCADCAGTAPSPRLPVEVLTAPASLLRGYDADARIREGTGGVVATHDIPGRCVELFARPELAFIDIRSVSHGCFLMRVVRA